MPNFNFGQYNPYEDVGGALSGPANTFMQIMLALPRERAQAAEMMARTGLLGAEQQNQLSHQALNAAHEAQVRQQTGFAQNAFSSAPGALGSLAPGASPDLRSLLGALVAQTHNPQEAVHALGQAALMGGGGDAARLATGTFGPTPFSRQIAPGVTTPFEVPAGGTVFSGMSPRSTPAPVATNPQAFAPHAETTLKTAYANGTEKIKERYFKAMQSITTSPEEKQRLSEEMDKELQGWNAMFVPLMQGLPTGTNSPVASPMVTPPNPVPAPVSGVPTKTAFNPATNERIGLVNGQWIPLK